MLLDHPEYARWSATAERQVAVARHSAAGGFHEAAVLHAEQAAQCALKALLHLVGQTAAARGHSLVDLHASAAAHAGLALPETLVDSLRDLASAYQPTRYPDALPGGTPADHYGEAASTRAIATAEATLALVEQHQQALVAGTQP